MTAMKTRPWGLLVLLCLPVMAAAQETDGTVVVVLDSSNRITDTDGKTFLDGDAFLLQLYAGPTEAEMIPAGEPETFGAGKFAGSNHKPGQSKPEYKLPNVGQGVIAKARLHAWEVAAGESYEVAKARGGKYGVSEIVSVMTGGYDLIPPGIPGSVSPKSFSLTDAGAGLIAKQPVSAYVVLGHAGELSVVTTSPEEATYQWLKDGVELPGATAATLKFDPITADDLGEYRVVVRQAGLAKLSVAAVVTVQRLAKGGTVFFKNRFQTMGFDEPILDADGSTRLEGSGFLAQLYAGVQSDWLMPVGEPVSFGTGRRAGYLDVSATALAIQLPNVPPGGEAFFQVRAWESVGESYDEAFARGGRVGVSNVFKVKTGNDGEPPELPAMLNGLESFSLASEFLVEHPAGGWFLAGDELELRVAVSDPVGVVTYEWRKDGEALPGENSATLRLAKLSEADSGVYQARVRNAKRDRMSISAVVKVWPRKKGASIAFANRVQGRQFFSPIVDHAGNPLAGDSEGGSIVAQLFAGPVDGELAAVGEPVPLGLGDDAGYLADDGTAVGIPDVAPGETAAVQVRVWDSAKGDSVQAAFENDGRIGVSEIVDVVTGGSEANPPPTFIAGLGKIKVNRLTFGKMDPTTILLPSTEKVIPYKGKYRSLMTQNSQSVLPFEIFGGSRLETEVQLYAFKTFHLPTSGGGEVEIWVKSNAAALTLTRLGLAEPDEPVVIESNWIENIQLGQAGEYRMTAWLNGVPLPGPKIQVNVHAIPDGASLLFSNHEDAPVIDAKRNYISGAAFRAQLLAGLDPKNLSPVGEPLPFYQSGFWRVEDLNIVVIPNVTPGEKVWVQVRVWETAEGEPEFAHAEEAERLVGDSNVFQVVTGGAGDPRTQPATLDELKTVVVRKPDPKFVLIDDPGETSTSSVEDGEEGEIVVIDAGDFSGNPPTDIDEDSGVGDAGGFGRTAVRYGRGRGAGVRLVLKEGTKGRVAIETSEDLKTWSTLGRTPAGDGVFAFDDKTADGHAARFYRVTDADGNVVSTRATGYAEVYFPTGFTLFTVPFVSGENIVTELLPVVPEGSMLYVLEPDTGFYTINSFDWGEWDTPDMILPPGTGAFFRNDSDSDVLIPLRGAVPEGLLAADLGARWELVGSPVPQAGRVDADLGLPIGEGDLVLRLPPGGSYLTHRFEGGQWLESEDDGYHGVPEVRIGEGFWIYKPEPAKWIREFHIGD